MTRTSDEMLVALSADQLRAGIRKATEARRLRAHERTDHRVGVVRAGPRT